MKIISKKLYLESLEKLKSFFPNQSEGFGKGMLFYLEIKGTEKINDNTERFEIEMKSLKLNPLDIIYFVENYIVSEIDFNNKILPILKLKNKNETN